MTTKKTPVAGTQETILSRAVVDFSRLSESRIKLTYVVSELYQLGGSLLIQPQSDVVAETKDPFDEIPAINPITDEPVPGKVYTQDDLYNILYSIYFSARPRSSRP